MDENPYKAPVDGTRYRHPDRPKVLLFLAMGGMLGIVVSVALAVAAVFALARIDVRDNRPNAPKLIKAIESA